MILGKSAMVWSGKHLNDLTDDQLLAADLGVRQCREAVAQELGDTPILDSYDQDIAELTAHLADRGLTRAALPAHNPFLSKVRRSHALEAQ